MRRIYLVTYDIADDKRLRRVFKKMNGYGEHLQYSVFQCELSDKERVQMVAELNPLINHREDQMLIFTLGQAESYNAGATLAIGKPYVFVERHAVVV
ncbi:MAG TPA: CRISPR-associated endonuclease Cas2 [Candidatus Hydrogenedentes bacterium]|nr:CRISPR-associated endonuclease Cas2 [Candidatus Hydrogenedentota bacterium]HIJ73197.1 CRISPR-associated endonuclease Cas2 [Candidatus Hydrogenedentota bacterium]